MPYTDFYPSTRRICVLSDYRQLESKEPESKKRKKLTVSMPIDIEDPQTGCPELIGDCWQLLLKNPEISRINLELEYKGITIEFYATEKGKHRELLIPGCDLCGFYLEQHGEDEKQEISLVFTIYAPDSKELHDFVQPKFHKTSYLTFEEMQTAIDFQKDNTAKPGAGPGKVKDFDADAIRRASANA